MLKELPEELIYRTVELFLDQDKVKRTALSIAQQINREFKPPHPLTRESVYKIVAQARDNGFLRLAPPLEQNLQSKLEEKFPHSRGKFVVVSTLDKSQGAKVAEVAAERAVEKIWEFGDTSASGTVGIGLGPGRATLDFCKYLSVRIRSEIDFPKLRLIAISAGCPARMPEYASSSFFHLFQDDQVAERIGMFAESLVRAKDLPTIKKTPGVQEAFDSYSKDEIDLVVTAMGDFADPHDLLRIFLIAAGITPAQIKRRRWLGNVQYRPYTARGPVEEEADDLRAVTVYELSDLAAMSKLKNKHVILIARQCGICGTTRAQALRFILENPDLRIFSELVLDAETAKELVRKKSPMEKRPCGNVS